MNNKSILTSFTETLEKNKALRTAVIAAVIIAAAVLFLTSGVVGSCAKTAAAADIEPAAQSTEAQTETLERRLESMLSSLSGVGKTKVMLTFESTEEQIIATDSRNQTAQNGSTEETKPATVNSGGAESPIVLTERMPKVRGVIVAAEGAGNFSVKMNIIAAVSTVLGIDQSCVEVFVMAG